MAREQKPLMREMETLPRNSFMQQLFRTQSRKMNKFSLTQDVKALV